MQIQKRKSDVRVGGSAGGTLKVPPQNTLPQSLQLSLKAQSISLLPRDNIMSF